MPIGWNSVSTNVVTIHRLQMCKILLKNNLSKSTSTPPNISVYVRLVHSSAVIPVNKLHGHTKNHFEFFWLLLKIQLSAWDYFCMLQTPKTDLHLGFVDNVCNYHKFIIIMIYSHNCRHWAIELSIPHFLPLLKEFNKVAFTPKDFHEIWVYPWRVRVYPWKISSNGDFFSCRMQHVLSLWLSWLWNVTWILNRYYAFINNDRTIN